MCDLFSPVSILTFVCQKKLSSLHIVTTDQFCVLADNNGDPKLKTYGNVSCCWSTLRGK